MKINFTDTNLPRDMPVWVAHLPHGIMCQKNNSSNISVSLTFVMLGTTYYTDEGSCILYYNRYGTAILLFIEDAYGLCY